MSLSTATCDLCGLSLTQGRFRLPAPNGHLSFCCPGCSMVYSMLLEAADAPDPNRFRETDLFQSCVAAGVIPTSEAAQARLIPPSPAPRTVIPGEAPRQPGDGEVQGIDLLLEVAGMWCPACAWIIAETLRRQAGVQRAVCRFATDSVALTYNPVETSPEVLAAVLARLGYSASRPGEESRATDRRRAFIRFFISAFLSMNVMMFSFALYSGFFIELTAEGIANIAAPMAVMASVVFLYGGWPIHRRAWSGLRARAAGMETLISMGSGSAYLYSLYQWQQGSIHLYFDSASMLITLVLLGKLIEGRAKARVQKALTSLFDLAPRKVRLCTAKTPRGRFVSADSLRPGDRFRVAVGEQIAADGRVITGGGDIDEAALTGEARPVGKRPGDEVRGGGRLVSGEIEVRATATCEESLLGQMLAVVARSLDSRTAAEGRTDRLLRIFAPLVAALAAATFAACVLAGLPVGQSLLRAITVLVISCPCALGIAIPLARVAGLALASGQGILVRDFAAFEKAVAVDTVVFDKTGTLTSGSWRLERVELGGELDEAAAIALAAGLEQKDGEGAVSDHPVAGALLSQAVDRGLIPLTVSHRQVGRSGISATWMGRPVRIGNRAFCGLDRSPEGPRNDSPVFLTIDAVPAATFYFADPLRPGAAETVETLSRAGRALHLVTGDDGGPAHRLAGELGFAHWRAELSPLDKSAYIQDLRLAGGQVAMVGDGVNDAAALGAADLGVALYAGHPLGHEVSDITLMAGDPRQLLHFNRLAAVVQRKIRQNLGWSLAYNLISIPVAMSGWLTPLVAVCAMLASSLSVTLNTYALVRHRFERGPDDAEDVDAAVYDR
jgi:heavy metal translocating P-type ATPase